MNNPLTKTIDLADYYCFQLNQQYCMLSHLSERFVDIVGHPSLSDLAFEIKDLLKAVTCQITLLEKTSKKNGVKLSLEGCDDLIDTMENSFYRLQVACETKPNSVIMFLQILAYLNNFQSQYKNALFQANLVGQLLNDRKVKYPMAALSSEPIVKPALLQQLSLKIA